MDDLKGGVAGGSILKGVLKVSVQTVPLSGGGNIEGKNHFHLYS